MKMEFRKWKFGMMLMVLLYNFAALIKKLTKLYHIHYCVCMYILLSGVLVIIIKIYAELYFLITNLFW